jgi:hypothetical protein
MNKQSESKEPERPEVEKKSRRVDGEHRDMVLTHHEAEAGSPADVAACGEEDPGVGLEQLVTREDDE